MEQLAGIWPANMSSLLVSRQPSPEQFLSSAIHPPSHGGERLEHRLNMELDLQSLFGLLCTAVLIG
jgi:hypothetical protein